MFQTKPLHRSARARRPFHSFAFLILSKHRSQGRCSIGLLALVDRLDPSFGLRPVLDSRKARRYMGKGDDIPGAAPASPGDGDDSLHDSVSGGASTSGTEEAAAASPTAEMGVDHMQPPEKDIDSHECGGLTAGDDRPGKDVTTAPPTAGRGADLVEQDLLSWFSGDDDWRSAEDKKPLRSLSPTLSLRVGSEEEPRMAAAQGADQMPELTTDDDAERRSDAVEPPEPRSPAGWRTNLIEQDLLYRLTEEDDWRSAQNRNPLPPESLTLSLRSVGSEEAQKDPVGAAVRERDEPLQALTAAAADMTLAPRRPQMSPVPNTQLAGAPGHPHRGACSLCTQLVQEARQARDRLASELEARTAEVRRSESECAALRSENERLRREAWSLRQARAAVDEALPSWIVAVRSVKNSSGAQYWPSKD
ncbi:hypothetical protein ACP70R_021435 [Stipagrostis hirtigluma subsp. patula]